MKKLLFTMATGVFLAASSLIQAQCPTIPVITSPGVTICAGQNITVSGTFSSLPYSAVLYAGGSVPVATVNGINTNTFAIIYTVPSGSTNQFTVGVINTNCGEAFSNDDNPSLFYTITLNAAPNPYNVTTTGNFCATPSGYPIGTVGSKNTIAYVLYRDGVYVTSLPGHSTVPVTFPNQTALGTYSILGVYTATGCSTPQWEP